MAIYLASDASITFPVQKLPMCRGFTGARNVPCGMMASIIRVPRGCLNCPSINFEKFGSALIDLFLCTKSYQKGILNNRLFCLRVLLKEWGAILKGVSRTLIAKAEPVFTLQILLEDVFPGIVPLEPEGPEEPPPKMGAGRKREGTGFRCQGPHPTQVFLATNAII